MNRNVIDKMGLLIGAVMVLATGCADSGLGAGDAMGSARVEILVPQISEYEIDRVTVQATGGVETDLGHNGTGSFTGTLVLPAGQSALVGRAYAAGTLVGQSNPVSVEIQAGLVTAATILILDLTGGPELDHGPIVLSLTHPLSALANQPVVLSITAIDPDGDPLEYTWIDDCADSTFTDAQAATTEWSKPAEGTCAVSVMVRSRDLSVVRSFRITVFAEGSTSGAVNVDGRFVAAPRIHTALSYGSTFCAVSAYEGVNASCSEPITTRHTARGEVFIEWGNAQPGIIEVFDDCGGTFLPLFIDPFFAEGSWIAPAQEGVCFLTVRATSGEGVRAEMSVAVAVQAGEPPPPPPPAHILVDFFSVGCTVTSDHAEADCLPVEAGQAIEFFAQVDWLGATPGFIDLADDCGGFFSLFFIDPFFVHGLWTPVLSPTATCTVSVSGVAPDGQLSSQATARFPVF
jgi:hypothetical protein